MVAVAALHNKARRPKLTKRELEVARVWLRAGSKAATAEELHVAEPTVRTHIANIRQKYLAVDRPAGTKADLLLRLLADGHVQA